MRTSPERLDPGRAGGPDRPRRFRAYGVGLAKTGTTSLHGLFSRYRSAHEFQFQKTVRVLGDYREGLISRAQFRSWLRQRDRDGRLEMDSASFHSAYIDVLLEEFPDACYLLTLRDCYSWLESLITMCLTVSNPIPEWMVDYGRRVNGLDFRPEVFTDVETFLDRVGDVIDGLLRHWSEGNRRVLSALPGCRSLIVRTRELSASVERIAKFVGVPPESLVRERAHSFRAARRHGILRRIDRGLLRERTEHHCGALMREHFPGFTLDDFLEESASAE